MSETDSTYLFSLVSNVTQHICHHLSRLISDYLAGGEGKFHNKNFYNHLTSINCDIMRRDDGNVLIARELSDAWQTKIDLGLLTP